MQAFHFQQRPQWRALLQALAANRRLKVKVQIRKKTRTFKLNEVPGFFSSLSNIKLEGSQKQVCLH